MIRQTELQRRVLDELRMEPGLDVSAIVVTVEGGTVTLTGAVSSYEASRRADQAVKRVPGVVCVIDRLTLSPTEMP